MARLFQIVDCFKNLTQRPLTRRFTIPEKRHHPILPYQSLERADRVHNSYHEERKRSGTHDHYSIKTGRKTHGPTEGYEIVTDGGSPVDDELQKEASELELGPDEVFYIEGGEIISVDEMIEILEESG